MIVPRRTAGSLLILLSVLGFASFCYSRYNPVTVLIIALLGSPTARLPITTHLVLFQFKQSASPMAVKEITSKMISLKKNCIHPSTNRQYILSITGGKDNSIESLQGGITHAFILHFHSNEDRDYYVDHDPVQQAFKDEAAAVIEKVQVVDFQEGVFYKAIKEEGVPP
ncbi:hypothetical protein P154DRAFT_520856 [Amniculicola lignicola CBS 123094]|uniref:Stress-response A/B barrel domain-containing protein n=1 Tax=Amniculicola lignicola CBS 123094 TaxID=1392246 RepID=A0A6A5WNZ1_9PLEO|nr:hypothetical protein P154DRAFT_520856 [Amniculicola lignicola CBS 123094]